MSDIELEDIVARFEAEFVSGNKPEIRDFLPGDGGDNILIELCLLYTSDAADE